MPGERTAPALIVSTGRTGTRFLAEYLNRHYTDVEAHHITPRSTVINILSNIYLSGFMSERMLLGAWSVLKGRDFGRTDKSCFVDSNNHLFAFAGIARQMYPGVRIVHVVRDPRTYVRSHINWARQRAKSFVANHIIPFWQPNGWLLREVSLGDWLRMSTFERFCWVWDYKNRYLSNIRSTSTAFLQIRFEDFAGSGTDHPALGQLATFLGLPPPGGSTSDAPVNQTTNRQYPSWADWPPEQCRQLDTICGEQMRSFGYGTEPEWLEKLGAGMHESSA
jgi:hypothetical protein